MQAKQMLATMSHEIRSPLSGVVSMAEVLATTDLDAEQRQLVDVMLTSGDLVLQLINNILDLSKIESGERKLLCLSSPSSPFNIQSWMILFGAKFVLKIWTFCAKFVKFLGIWDINSAALGLTALLKIGQ
jgi:signal transduction histidine kinase